jgi:hypothetical protein
MRKLINHEELKKEWILETWFEKFIYVWGWITLIWMGLAFIIGFVSALIGTN